MISLFFPIITASAIILWFVFFFIASRKKAPLPDSPDCYGSFRRMTRRDVLAMLIISLAYAVVAFTGLGDHNAPESDCYFKGRGSYADIELPEDTEIGSVLYFCGLNTGDYYLQFSMDGQNWVDQKSMPQKYTDLFKWRYAELLDEPQTARYIRILSGSELYLCEVAIYDSDGTILDASRFSYGPGVAPLFDEQGTVPSELSYMNSTYFDEIYHARTAYEHIRNIYPYEISHPPLGKLIISVGIRIFGMNPFGWRFMGTLFGVLMLPILYFFIKKMFGSTAISACGTTIFAFDFMHFVQTRIATIDTYAVIFTILMYLFMYMYVSADHDDPLLPWYKQSVPLFLSGLFFGIGAASKWTCIYAGAGLAVIWLGFWVMRGISLARCGHFKKFLAQFFASAAQCIVFFVLIPAAIYYLSYIPYGTAKGMSGLKMLLSRDYLDIVIDNNKFMYTYHSGVDATHPYSSWWYQWIVDARPILYYLQGYDDGTKSAFGAFVNPVLCWGGLLAMLSMVYFVIRDGDRKALFILVGYLAQLLPWVFVTRIVFEYHYFPSTVFLLLALCLVFDKFRHSSVMWKKYVFGFAGVCVCLFAAFYPVLTGVRCPTWYTNNFLRWIPGMWPF